MIKMGNLKAELARKNISLVELSKILKIHYNSLGKKMNGASKFSIEEAFIICEALEIDDVKYLFKTE